jgi:hypothetical protein
MRPTLLLATLAACAEPPFIERDTQVRFEPGHDFWALPFPSDLRRQADGTGGLEEWPIADPLVQAWLRTVNERLGAGWGVTPGVFLPITGAIAGDSLPGTIVESTFPNASVFVLDVDPASPDRGRRLPVEVSFSPQGDDLAPDNLLAVVPASGFVRRPSTRYGLVVTNTVRDANGSRLGRARAFHDAFEDTGDADPGLVAHLADLRATLAAEGFELGRVVGGTVFTTHDPDIELRRLATWVEGSAPETVAEPWQVETPHDNFQVLTSRFPVPRIQRGTPPYTRYGDGRIAWVGGAPAVQELETTRVALTIPLRPQPAAGFAIALYAYDLGGDFMAAVRDGPAAWLADQGVATVAFDYPLHGDRAPPGSAERFVSVVDNPTATLDNFAVTASEYLRITRLVTTTTIDASLTPTLDAGTAEDGRIRFDPNRVILLGQSLGATLSITAATVDARVDGVILGGAGGLLFESPAALETLLGARGIEARLHRTHPLTHALQHGWDRMDPVARAASLNVDRLLFAGFRDAELEQRSIAALAVSLGADLVGTPVDSVLPEALALLGREPVPYPLAANSGARTAGVVQVSAPNERGHLVLLERPDVVVQASTFAAGVGTAAGATVTAPQDAEL